MQSAEQDVILNVQLRAYRDRAFLVTLADTGFRVHEACNLRRGDIDWNEGRAVIIGKGNKQAVVRFSSRSLSITSRLFQALSFQDRWEYRKSNYSSPTCIRKAMIKEPEKRSNP
ncbi:MAG: tyrosine-type recombinase/integrase [Anaerolineales bacterium]|nr:tyrosine-type recombinase/integrase [Anaerolineales bacterium]